ncbi:nucleotide-binding alpha-beta plait domain-containing protein [Artemisia annua]|uniref:Nucleotide-binding alpha-beta plait domain-containing protein n=1 Tax=Artemisia annua TaxID=35608 RepID=A0A2U1P5X7_ARTAN|nr:nucleotide-binding alpha-beta plait domain-containing protein [Artemisia annua]
MDLWWMPSFLIEDPKLVYDVDRLVNNLCTVWIGSHHLHANVAKFNRPSATPNEKINGETRPKPKEGHNSNDQRVNNNSYAHAVKGESTMKEYTESKPVLVLDDSCVNQHGYHLGLMGKVKEFTLFLGNEGFQDIELCYLGGLWVLISFITEESKVKFMACVGAVSWFSRINHVVKDFVLDERITWVDVEGVPLKMWSDNPFKRIAAKWGKILCMENTDGGFLHCKRMCILTFEMSNILNEEDSDSEDEQYEGFVNDDLGGSDVEMQGDNFVSVVPDTRMEEENNKIKEGEGDCVTNDKKSDDPFNLYSLLNKKKEDQQVNVSDSIPFPPGFTPGVESICEHEKKYIYGDTRL